MDSLHTRSTAMTALLAKVTPDAENFIEHTEVFKVNCLNGYSLAVALEDPVFYQALINSDLLLCDGVLVKLLCQIITKRKVNRLTGPDFAEAYISRHNHRFLFLGATDDILNQLVPAVQRSSNAEILVHAPKFVDRISDSFVNETAHLINDLGPTTVFLGLTAPKQEILAEQLEKQTLVKNYIQVGAFFEFKAGTLKRAPVWVSTIGFEWLWRFMKQPQKIGYRILTLRKVLFALAEYLFLEACKR